MTQMKLGWWRDRDGDEWVIDGRDNAKTHRWTTSETRMLSWDDSGKSSLCSDSDLIEFIRPFEELAPALNSAVKAAEDMVRRLEAQYHAAQRLANEACENLNHARRELERLEKECEVKS